MKENYTTPTAFSLFLPMSTSYFHGVILCIAVFTDLLETQGKFILNLNF